MAIELYNTMTGQKEPLETIEPGVVKMYLCGPTVYSDAHVGHARSAMEFDIIRRYLEYRGYDVQFVMNYTDVDDKIINRANEEGADPIKLAEWYIDQYSQHLADLNIKSATQYPRVTQLISEIIAFIQALVDNNYAYELNGSVYFRVAKDDDYGKLSNRSLNEARSGTRAIVDDDKEDEADFALWKAAKPGELSWESPWGPGRPGWHIECSVMCRELLGDQIDIHGGGNDLIFPHHENEIAQTESLTGKPFARYWVHNGMLQLEGEKMSKSIGNVFSIHNFLERYDGDVFRILVLNSGYRGPLMYNIEVVEQSKARLDRIFSALKPARPDATGAPDTILQALNEQIEVTGENFIAAMDDDFNSAGAMGHLFDLVKQINTARDNGATDGELKHAQMTLRELAGVLGLRLQESIIESSAEPFIELLVDIRQELRQQKLWALSDKIRDQLAEQGVVIEDSAGDSSWHWSR
ncbi:MAG: cysteine--tRNA ligase [Chloroflexi bacterium]|nr:cysteine--tRNA ligase [Chloroflexota bacterium]